MQDTEKLYSMRHSLAHITASAVRRLWPKAKFGVGPVVENGFYYDIDLGDQTISEEDFTRIEAEMRKIVSEKQTFEQFDRPVDSAIEWARAENQPYKEELLNDLKREGTTSAKDIDAAELGIASDRNSKVESVSFYKNGDFTDLCRGPHVNNTGEVGFFKLMRVAGAYWRGKETNPQMQRLYGVAFASKEELDSYLELLEKAKQNDHRKLGRELDLFVISELVGPGLPLFTPRGTLLRKMLIQYSEQIQERLGYQAVWAPHMARTALYKASGHFDKYPERFSVTSSESDDEFMMKPMNCPHVAQIYASQPRSFRDLPLRFMETTTMYRDEKSGELHGLSRVRALTQDDSHAFVRHDQIEEEFRGILGAVKEMYETLGMPLRVDLSFRDESDAYFGDKELWEKAQHILEAQAKDQDLDYKVELGEAAFYGPKIDIYVSDSLGREWQCATVQLDFVQPERFELEYTDSDGSKQRPAMIHKAILGSIERFLSVYIEHTAGWFPFWMAPEQVRVLTINDTVSEYASSIEQILAKTRLDEPLRYNELRYSVDDRNESLGKKIRAAVSLRVPVLLIIGPRDVAEKVVSVRLKDKEEKIPLEELENFLKSL